MQKLYCYVDETGQDTKGQFFLVCLVVTSSERETLRAALTQLEARSGKHKLKWTKATLAQKQAYISAALSLSDLKGKLLVAEYQRRTDYLNCTIEAIAKGVARVAQSGYRAIVLIDALGKHQRKAVGAKLRRAHVHIEKVRGIRDEVDEFIRLADAVAGFARDYREGKTYAVHPYTRAKRRGVIVTV
jgi:hypothetical protein